MTIRVVTPADGSGSVTVPAPGDPYATPTTFYAGQLVGIDPGGAWETAIGVGNLTALAGTAAMADDTQGDGGQATDNP